MRITRIAGFAMLLIMATTAPALANHHHVDHEVPVAATVQGEHWVDGAPGPDGWQFNSAGVGQMSHLGRVDYFLTQHSSFGPGGLIYSTGTVTFTAANGDTLVIAQQVTSEIYGAFEGFTLEGTWSVVDGTGRFAHASGSGLLSGIGDIPGGDAVLGLPDGGALFNFNGAIAYEASDRSN